MVFRMARPTTAKNGRLPNFRRRIPTDLLETARGRSFIFVLPKAPDEQVDNTIRAAVSQGQIKFSLQTKDPAMVRRRHSALEDQFERHMETLRLGPIDLTPRQCSAFSGMIYKLWAGELADDPRMTTDEWQREAQRIHDMRERGGNPLFIPEETRIRVGLEELFGKVTSFFLSKETLSITDKSRGELLIRIAKDMEANARLTARYADGDYSPDSYVQRFPDWTPLQPPPQASGQPTSVTFDQLFDRWNREAQRAPGTVGTYRSYWNDLRAFVGHDRPSQITEADIIRWKDSLVERGRSATSGHLPAIKVLFVYAVANGAVTGIQVNPAANVRMVRPPRRPEQASMSYTDQEVGRLLAAAKKEDNQARRWVPWLVALSGARVGEITQLWGSSISEQAGIVCMTIAPAPDGGSLKNLGSQRTVPIHPAIIEQGFLDFWKSKGSGPLFYAGTGRAAANRSPDGGRHPSKGVNNRLAVWVRADLGFTDPRKKPMHALRHWFKSECARPALNIQDSLANAIQGHQERDVASVYRHFRLEDFLVAIRKIKVPVPTDSRDGAQ